MENNINYKPHEEPETPDPVDDELPLIEVDDSYTCTSCSSSVEILEINDKENTITFKCLNKSQNHNTRTIPINEYINSMKKYNHLHNECSICFIKQDNFKDIPIFSYCIKCDKIICTDCINDHLKKNEINHPNLNKEYIIKNNEKEIKCWLHPSQKNVAFCFDCDIHLCNECMKSKKHMMHRKNTMIEILPADEVLNKFKGIIKIYKERSISLKKEKAENESKLYNKLKDDNEKVKIITDNKIKEIKNELNKEILKNEKLLNNDLNNSKMKYENEVNLVKDKYKIIMDNINKKYQQLENLYNNECSEKLNKIMKEYNETIDNLEYNKKIKYNDDLLLINQIILNAQMKYGENYYNNNNINNIIYSFYKSKDNQIKELLTKDKNNIYDILSNKIIKEEKFPKFNLKNNKIKKINKQNRLLLEENADLKEEIEKLKNEITEKYICSIKTNKYKGNGFLCYIPQPVLITFNDVLKKEDIAVGKQILISFDNDKTTKKIIIDKNRKICTIDKLDTKKTNIVIIELKSKEDDLENIEFLDQNLFKIAINKYRNKSNEILIQLNVEKNEVGKKIYYLDNNHKLNYDNLPELNEETTDVYINNKKVKFGKYFIPKNDGIYIIKLKFKIKIKSCAYMFYNCKNITDINLNSFNTENVKNMKHMFSCCENLEKLNLSSINTRNVTNMANMFNRCINLSNIDLCSFDTKNVKTMVKIFNECEELQTINLCSFDTKNVKDMKFMFNRCYNLKEIKFSLFNTKNVNNMKNMFKECYNLQKINLSSFNTQNVKSMANMFSYCENLIDINLSSFNTKNVKSMKNMFNCCENLTNINLSSFNDQNVIDMGGLFKKCLKLTDINLSSLSTKNVTNMCNMFSGCEKLGSINLSSFNTEKLKNMSYMFCDCENLENINLSSFNTKNVNKMYFVFMNCGKLTNIDLSSFSIKSKTRIDGLFFKCNNLKSIKISKDLNNKIKKIIPKESKLIII